MGTDNTGAPVVTPPPAPSLDQLYGPQGGLVAAPPAPPATIPDTDNQPNAATRAVSSFESASGLPPGTPKEYAQNLGQGAKEIVTHPVEAAKLVGGGMLDAQAEQTRQGNDAFKRGDYGQALAHYLYGGIPIAGPIMAHAAEQIQNKDYAGAAGTIAAVVTPAAAEHVAPEAAAGLTEAAADVKASAQRAFEAKAPVGSAEAGKIDLSSVGGTKVGDARRSPNTFGRTPNTSFGETVNRTFQAERDRAESAKPTSTEEKLPEGDYVYHATDVSRAPNIRENGLKPKSWYANSPEEAMKSGAVPISGNRADLRVFAVPKAEIEPVAPDAADMGAREVEKGRFTMSAKGHQPIEVTQDGRPLSPLPVSLEEVGGKSVEPENDDMRTEFEKSEPTKSEIKLPSKKVPAKLQKLGDNRQQHLKFSK